MNNIKDLQVAVWSACILICALMFVSGTIACSWLTPRHIEDVGKLVVCVLDHDKETPEQIVVDCAAGNIQTVLDILSAHKNAMIREMLAR